jgi:hypothetical protein
MREQMNEKIKELMLEAGYAAPEIAGRANKFAKLIVSECAGLVDHVRMEDGTTRGEFIRKHFGVEL